jgi:hypothetical protein
VIVSGLKTFDPETSTFLKFPKKYGYALTAATLPLGVRQYFVDARGRLAHRHHIPTLISQLKECMSKYLDLVFSARTHVTLSRIAAYLGLNLADL